VIGRLRSSLRDGDTEFVAYCKEAGAEVMELSGWPQSYAGTLVLGEAGVEQVRAPTHRAGIEVCARNAGTRPAPTSENRAHCGSTVVYLGDR
jgi:hypothetical protein